MTPILDVVLDSITAVSLVLGAALALIAGIGLLRFPDALSRLHAGTKPQILGLAFIVLAIAVDSRSWATVLALLPIMLLQVLTQPVAAHMIGRAGYRTGNYDRELIVVDELEDAVAHAADAAPAPPRSVEN